MSLDFRLAETVRILGAVMLSILAATESVEAWAQAQIGYVHALSGIATAQRGSAKPGPLKVGETFAPGARFGTGAASALVLKFADGQTVAMGPSSLIRLDRYQYDPKNPKASGVTLGLIDGTMRFVGGQIAAQNREAVSLVAGESPVSILKPGGVDFTVVVRKADGGESGVASVAVGEIAVHTPYGTIARIDADHAAPWRPDQTLREPIPLAAASAAVQAELAGMRVIALPVNAPVAIQAAALAAARAADEAPKMTTAVPGTRGLGSGQAAYVHELSGRVLVQHGKGPAVPLQLGDTFDPGTIVDTGTTGKAVFKFADGQVVALGPNSVLRVDQYRFDENNIRNSSVGISLLNGSMRFVGGEIAADNPGRVRVTAGASVVQIASAGSLDYTVVVDTRGQELGVTSVKTGVIAVRTPYGQISKVEANEVAPWLAGRAPAAPVPVAQAPTAVQGQLAMLSNTTLPPSGPVPVEAAANAVVAVTAADQAKAAAQANPADTQLQTAAQAAAAAATAAVQATTSAVENLVAKIIETKLSALPATAAGIAQTAAVVTPDAAAAPSAATPVSPLQVAAAPADLQVTPIAPITATTTPGGGGTCVGSPC